MIGIISMHGQSIKETMRKSNCKVPNGNVYQYIFIEENIPDDGVQEMKPTSARVNEFLKCHNYLPGMIDLGEV